MKDYSLFIDCLAKLVSYKSVKSEPKRGMPFGEGVYSAYKYFIELAQSFGFKTMDYDGYAGEIVFGEGEEMGVIGHVDVVPEGNGWNTNPYELTKIGNTFYARGVIDDKAPLLACLFVLKELKELGVKPNKRFRLIVGCDEESGWRDVDYVKTKTRLPKYGFSPDGNFPVCYAEKGIAVIEFVIPALKGFYGINGGTVINAVCGYATVKCKAPQDEKLLVKHGLKLDGDEIVSVGKSAHGSKPQLGVNALKALFEYFAECGEDVQKVIDYLFNDKAGVFNMRSEQGNVTLSPDIICEKDGKIYIKCDCRFPAPIEFSEVRKKLDLFNLEYSYEIERGTQYVEKDGELIRTLLNAYDTVTGEQLKPLAIGGSTFARVFEKGCAFGPEFSWENNHIHEPNECVTENALLKAYEIFKNAIFCLAGAKL